MRKEGQLDVEIIIHNFVN